MIFLIALLLLVPSALKAENPANFYLVWRASFTQTNLDNVKNLEIPDHFQPIRKFGLLTMTNTDFYLMTITTKTNIQNTVINLLESQGRIRRIKAIWGVDGEYDGSVGGTVIRPRREIFNPIPEEVYRKSEFQVVISS